MTMVDDIRILFVMIAVFAAFWSGYLTGRDAHPEPEKKHDSVVTVHHTDSQFIEPDPAAIPEAFAVAGRQRPATWRERRRELEAKQRTKRAQREQWRG